MSNAPLRAVVIGAGAIGTSVAAELSERGVRVTLIDGGTPGSGTSSTTFGWLNSNGKEPFEYYDINRLGMEAHRRLSCVNGDWLGASGHIEVASKDEHSKRLANRVETLRSRGYRADLISREAAADALPGVRIPHDAQLIARFPDETYVYPALYVGGQLRRGRAAGVELVTNTEVTGIESKGSGAEVTLADGSRIETEMVISAAGRWTSKVAKLAGASVPMREFEAPGDPTVGYLLETAPVPVVLNQIVTMPRLNLRPLGGGRLLLQALDLDVTADPDRPQSIDSEVAAELLTRLAEVIDGGEFARPQRLVVGRRAIPADGLTVAGRVEGQPWFYVVATHSGMTLAPYLGEAVADEVLGNERPELARFRPSRLASLDDVRVVAAPRLPGQQ